MNEPTNKQRERRRSRIPQAQFFGEKDSGMGTMAVNATV